MLKLSVKYLIPLACILIISRAEASHIVGGDITYKYVGDDNYQIDLHLYVDCFNGIPLAIELDREVNVSFYNTRTNEFIDNDALDVIAEVNVQELNYNCLSNEPNACVSQFTFSYTKKLFPGEDGITIAYQRCCRNKTINNIIDPANTGATFFTEIPPVSVVKDNSSPVFDKLPPNFLCTNAPLIFDHKATDVDGDSLVYSLILPYLGADPTFNRPIPASPPPYNQVIMNNPYTLSDMMGGSVKLQIDPETGLLQVTPSDVGQFVMAVLVEEYRDGVKIAEMHRDYQLNVIECSFNVSADFLAEGDECDSIRTFVNRSLGNGLSFIWQFEDGEESTSRDVSKTYAEPGTYKVSLIAYADNCRDTIIKLVTVNGVDYIDADLTAAPLIGCDSLTVHLQTTQHDTLRNVWDFGDQKGPYLDTIISEYSYGTPGSYLINYQVIDKSTCDESKDTSVYAYVYPSKHYKIDFNLETLSGCESNGIVHIYQDSFSGPYLWEIEDEAMYYDSVLTQYKFDNQGTYNFTLRSVDTGYCIINDSLTKSIYVDVTEDVEKAISLYNVFTPDQNDDLNKCFEVDLANRDCAELVYIIYNRWGEVVFEGGSDDCWDGTHYQNGNELPEGEYFGVYELTTFDDSKIRTSNVISLIRQ